MEHVFKGRTLAVINDLSNEERLYLFNKTKELKEAVVKDDQEVLSNYRIDDPTFGIYEVFLEDSTRTRESFKNAAKFHRVKLSSLSTDSSSFNKGESYADTFNTLTGYDNRVFIIRSKLEGVCRWLQSETSGFAERNNLPFTPSFINAGDGKHEHPTQELLDEYTFLEDNDWNTDSIHIALVGDLFHGRTVHSKAHGLTIFDKVKIDLIAPEELEMPPTYIAIMESHGYEIRCFPSIDAYLSQGEVADKWYFTRPQLERMGDRILQKQDELRKSITFNRAHLDIVAEGTKFYHPLPRHKSHPVIPTFLDETPFNGWERQSANGMLVRIVLLALFSGKLGEDFLPTKRVVKSNKRVEFIEKVEPKVKKKSAQYSEGVHPITNGIVIDHIGAGDTTSEIRAHMTSITKVLGLHGKGGEWVSTSSNTEDRYKGIIFRPDFQQFDLTSLKRLAALAPGSTLNIIEDGKIKEKYRMHLPPKIYNFEDLGCKNPNCISHRAHDEGVPAYFWKTKGETFVCEYCGKLHSFKEIWN